MTLERNNYIDTIKGLCILSVVFIHTVYWSGTTYVPTTVRWLSLLFDVPVFFFMIGATLSVTNKVDPIKQITKLVCYFTVLVVVAQIVTFKFNLVHIIEPLTLNGAKVEAFPTINGSYWFVPVYCVALISAYAIIHYMTYTAIPFITAAFIFHLYAFYSGYNVSLRVLGIPFSSWLFFTASILLGYKLYRFRSLKWWSLSALFFAGIYIFMVYYNPVNFNLQKYKFPVGLPYWIASMISFSLIMRFAAYTKANFFTAIGKQSIFYYISQGVGSSCLLYINDFIKMTWYFKLPIMFIINVIITLIVGKALIQISLLLSLTIQKLIKQSQKRFS